MKKLIKILAISGGVVLAAFVMFGIYTAREANRYQSVILDRELGFSTGSPYIIVGDDSFEVFTLRPQPGSLLAAAGVRDGDIVLDHGITDFYRALQEHRGSSVTFRVCDGGDGVPIAQRPVRTITLQVSAQPQTK